MNLKKAIALCTAGIMGFSAAVYASAGSDVSDVKVVSRTVFAKSFDKDGYKLKDESAPVDLVLAAESPSPTPTASVGPTPTASVRPTSTATVRPTPTPTTIPTPTPTEAPTPTPTEAPTPTPTEAPTPTPTEAPTPTPTEAPTPTPTEAPTPTPTEAPTPTPTEAPTPVPDDDSGTTDREEETPTPVPTPPFVRVAYNDDVVTAYADADSYMTAQVLGINVIAASDDIPADSSLFRRLLGDDPYVSNRTIGLVSRKSEVDKYEPDIIFGNSSGFSYSGASYITPPGDNTIEGMLSGLENTIDIVSRTASENSQKSRLDKGKDRLTDTVKDDGVIGDSKNHYKISYNSYDYYKSTLAYVENRLREIRHDKKKVAIFNPDTKSVYGSASDYKGAGYFRDICENIAGTGNSRVSVSTDTLNSADIIVTADFGDHTVSEVREVLRDMGVTRASEMQILTTYPTGLTGMKNNSIESLAGFAYCAGFAYYDLLPDKLFNPVSVFAYFYSDILGLSNSDIQSNIGDLIGNASLPDGVRRTDVNLKDAGGVMLAGHNYILNPTAAPTPTPRPSSGSDVTAYYGDIYEDGEINMKDATYLFLALSDLGELNDAGRKAADLNGDGAVRIDDYVILINYINKTKVHYIGDEKVREEVDIEFPYTHSKIE